MGKELYGRYIEVPIVGGAMSTKIAGRELASAITENGGIGILAGEGWGYKSKFMDNGVSFDRANELALQEEIGGTRKLTEGLFGVNLLHAAGNFEEKLKIVLNSEADIIVCGAGLAWDIPKFFKDHPRKKVWPIVSAPLYAERFCNRWFNEYGIFPDAIVVEGPKAGGHLGFKEDSLENPAFSLERTIPRIRRFLDKILDKYHVDIPIIAAGGIYTSEDLRKLIALGANFGQMATIFITTHECNAGKAFKQVHLEAEKRGLVIIRSPVGLPARAIKTKFSERVANKELIEGVCVYQCLDECLFRDTGETFCILEALDAAWGGDMEEVENHGIVLAGTNAGRAKEIVSVKDIMNEFKG